MTADNSAPKPAADPRIGAVARVIGEILLDLRDNGGWAEPGKIAAAALAAADRAAWQPISSAPRDGVPVLVCGGRHSRCQEATIVLSDGEWWNTEGAGKGLRATPTHWMPLPAPPQEPSE